MIDTDKYEYDCPQEGCGRETTHVEEDYFECRCGWFGQRISSIEDLEKEVKRLREGIKAYLNLDIETHELKELIE